MNKLANWEKFVNWSNSSRLRRWILYPVLSYLHRSHSLNVKRAKAQKGIYKREARLFWGEKMLVTLPEEVSSYIYRYQYFEPELTGALIRLLKPGMTFFDIGAHYGYFSKLASYLVGSQGHVYSLEPVPSTFEILRTNVAKNINVIPIQCAAFSRKGKMAIRDYGTRWSAFNSFTQARSTQIGEHAYQEVIVDVVCIDELMTQDIGFQPDFVKIDAESAEREILKGMSQLIQNVHPVLSLEVGDEIHIENTLSSHDLVEYVCDLGYEPYIFNGQDFVRHVIQPSYFYTNLLFFPKKQSN